MATIERIAQPEHMTVAQVAVHLGMSVESVRRRIATGELPAVRHGGPGSAVRIPRASLDAYLAEHSFPRDAA